jgi:hypothetical protein
LHSGLDVLLMPADPLLTATTLAEAHSAHQLADEVLDAAVGHIEAARQIVRSARPPDRRPDPDLAARLLASSLTSTSAAPPRLMPGEPIDLTVYGEDDSGMIVPAFVEALAAEGIERIPGARPIGLVITSVRAWANSARLEGPVRERLHWAAQNGRLDGIVVLGSPYELLEIPKGPPNLLAYEGSPAAAQQAVRVLCGRADAPGILPLVDTP